jgi:hypothetical protein
MQGRLMPAIRRTPPGEEAKEQDNALHIVGTLAYFLPLLLTPAAWLFGGLVALAARVALFDVVLNTAARRPAFEVGQTAATDKLLRKLAPTNPERLSAILRLGTAFLLACAAVALTL